MGVKGVVFGPAGIPAENADVVVWNPDGSRKSELSFKKLQKLYYKVNNDQFSDHNLI